MENASEKSISSSPHIPVSWGEIFDKLTILEIKFEKITSKEAKDNIKRELEMLSLLAIEPLSKIEELKNLKDILSEINRKLWKVEDEIRAKERINMFDSEFIDLARSVYIKNDMRFEIKRAINSLLNSDIVEEKSYQKY